MSNPSPASFSEVLDSLEAREGVWKVAVPDDWMQGRSVFGGLQAALALRAMRALVPAALPLRVLQTTFIAPVGGDVTVRAEVLRAGKGTTQVEARLTDGTATTALVVGVFGRGRPSKTDVLLAEPPVTPDHPFDFPVIEGSPVKFARHFKMRQLSGPHLFSGNRLPPRAVIEVTIHDRAPTSECHIVAIADAIPPLTFTMLTEPTSSSSVTWMLEILADGIDALPLTGFRVHGAVVAAHNGYASQPTMIFGSGGQPVALSTQSMLTFG